MSGHRMHVAARVYPFHITRHRFFLVPFISVSGICGKPKYEESHTTAAELRVL